MYVTVDFLAGRLRKRDAIHKFSEPTDWVFLVLLFLVALTGILVHVFRLGGLPLATYSTYVIHLAIVVPMLVVEVPFGKWGHMFYRPFAGLSGRGAAGGGGDRRPGNRTRGVRPGAPPGNRMPLFHTFHKEG